MDSLQNKQPPLIASRCPKLRAAMRGSCIGRLLGDLAAVRAATGKIIYRGLTEKDLLPSWSGFTLQGTRTRGPTGCVGIKESWLHIRPWNVTFFGSFNKLKNVSLTDVFTTNARNKFTLFETLSLSVNDCFSSPYLGLERFHRINWFSWKCRWKGNTSVSCLVLRPAGALLHVLFLLESFRC